MKRSLAILFGCLTPTMLFAAGIHITNYWNCTGFLRCGSSVSAVTFLIHSLINGVEFFIIPLATVAFLYGAVRMLLSRGEEGKEVGKKALIYASLGLVAAILVQGIIEFICGYIYLIGGASAPGTPVGTCPSGIWPF